MGGFYDAPRILACRSRIGEDQSENRGYITVAERAGLSIECGARTAAALTSLRMLARAIKVPLQIAGIIDTESSGERVAELRGAEADIISVEGLASTDDYFAAARVSAGAPFILTPYVSADGTLPDGRSFADLIERVDADPRTRPWHYMVGCAEPAHATVALEALFRAAPQHAHRVAGIIAAASSSTSPQAYGDAMNECAVRFGLHVLGTGAELDASFLAAIAG